MSNPGVTYLSSHVLDNGVEFRVEDNIGESIHIHYGDEFRLDITISKLLQLEQSVNEWIDEILTDSGFNIDNFDVMFLDMISDYLTDLEEVRIDRVKLSELKVETKGIMGLPVVRSLKKSRIIKFFNGDTKELLSYKQENLKGETNESRVSKIKSKILMDGYPFDNKYIVLFNNQNVIRDGQHRAACLFSENANLEVDVIRMYFTNEKYNVSYHPWIKAIFSWDLKRIKGMLNRVRDCTSDFRKTILYKVGMVK